MASKNSPRNGHYYDTLAKNLSAMDRFGVKRIGLFGSSVRDDGTEESDIDVLVEFDEASEKYANLIALHEFLQELFGRKVDLVTLNGLSPYLAPHILKEVRYVERAA